MNAKKKTKPLIYLIFIMPLLTIIILLFLSPNFAVKAPMEIEQKALKTNGFLLPKSLPLAEVKFSSTNEYFHSTNNFAGQWTLLTLGYTQCPEICPTTLYKLNQVVEAIPEEIKPRVAFLSIDILPNEVNKLSEYINFFNSDFIGLSTSTSKLDQFFKSLGAGYTIKKNDSDSLDIEHSTAIYLISPDKRYIASFPYILSAEQITQDYLLMRENEALL